MTISTRPLRAALVAACFATAAAGARPQSTSRISVTSEGRQLDGYSSHPLLSADGRYVVFDSDAAGLVPDDTNGTRDCFVLDRTTGVLERVDVSTTGTQTDAASDVMDFTPDGRFVLFRSDATTLVDPSPPHGGLYVHDRATGDTEVVSQRDDGSWLNVSYLTGHLSADGRLVAFGAETSDPGYQIYVRDRTTGTLEMVSVAPDGAPGDGTSMRVTMSADGNVVVFESYAKNLVPDNVADRLNTFLRDRRAGTTRRLSDTWSGGVPFWGSSGPSISPDGRFVAFSSHASDLVPGDSNGYTDVFLLDRATGLTELISVASDGTQGDRHSNLAKVSADGRYVAFSSLASTLVAGDRNEQFDVFVRDRATGTTERVSVATSGAEGDDFSGISAPGLSDDGRFVAFDSVATTLVDDDTNGKEDAFLHERPILLPSATATNYGAGLAGTYGEPTLTTRTPPVSGRPCVLDVSNSRQWWTVGLLMVGASSAEIPTQAGGMLLVDAALFDLIPFTPWSATIPSTVPADPSVVGVTVYLQVIELDPGAAKGLSFTPGLALMIGW